ncbi:MAG: bacillolysin [Candidatus Latescibacterota bacterium]|jgi:bacillolysin
MRIYFPMVTLLLLFSLGIMPSRVVAQSQTGKEASGAKRENRRDGAGQQGLKGRQQAQVDKMRQKDPGLKAHWDAKTGLLTHLEGTLSDPMPGNGRQVALDYFAANGSMIDMADANGELSILKVQTDHRGWEHVKLQQTYKGLPVEGRQLVLSISDQRQVRMVNCRHFVGALAVDTVTVVQSAAALGLVRTHLAAQRESGQGPTVQKVVYPHDGQSHLAWKIQLRTEEPLGDFIYYIDAHSGAVINHYNNMKFALDRKTYTASNGTSLPGTLTRSEGAGAVGDTPLDNAHDFAGTVYNYYFTSHARDSYDNAGATITSTVNYDSNYNNAFWNGTQMVYGDGDGTTFAPLSQSLDVVAHELTHAVTNFESNLIYQNESGALNESISDIFGALIDATNWQIGEDIYTPGTPGDALRYLDTPAIAGQQPDHMDQFVTPNASGSALDQACASAQNQDNGCVHINSGIPNKAAYLMAAGGVHGGITVAALAGARTDMGKIWYLAQTTYLTSSSDFLAAKQATEDAATALFGAGAKVTTVTNAWKAVGVGVANTALSPSSLSFGNVELGKTGTQALTISNTGSVDLAVTNITSDDAQFSPSTTSFTVAAGASQIVSITFTTDLTKVGTQTGTLTITHDAPNSPTTIAMTGDAAVGVSASAVSFRESGSQTISISNPATAIINLTTISSSDPQFVLYNGGVPIPTGVIAVPVAANGGIYDIDVVFTPKALGIQSATLSITHNPTILIALTGGFESSSAGSEVVQTAPSIRNYVAIPFGGEWIAVLLMCSCGCYALRRNKVCTGPPHRDIP